MEAIDETILNDENDEDLDYDLDPKEENALLQEEADLLGDYEDVLDINADYDQMDVSDDKLDTSSSSNDRKLERYNDDKNKVQSGKNDKINNFKNLRKMSKDNNFTKKMKKSRTVLLNPRFKGPVHVNGRPIDWKKPTSNQQYIQPWSQSNIAQPTVHPVSNYNPALFVPNNPYSYVQQPQQQQILQQPQLLQQQQILQQQQQQQIIQQQQILQPQTFAQPQVFMNSLPVLNQVPMLNQNIIPQQPMFQMNHSNSGYQPPPLPLMETIPQVPQVPKLPVHQRLGIPVNNMNPPIGNQIHFNTNESFHNQMEFQNHEYRNQFNQSSYNDHNQVLNVNQSATNNSQYVRKRFDNVKSMNFPKKQTRKFIGNQKVNNRVLLSPSRTNCNTEIQTSPSCEKSEGVQSTSANSNTLVVPEDEDEDTRQYRLKIEEQKKKREEVLRRKEENRLRNLSDVKVDIRLSPVVPKAKNIPTRNFKQKNFNYQQRSQHNFQFAKPQISSNNIVITGNDDQCHFNSSQNKKIGSYNRGFKSPTLRIVTAEPIPYSNINSNRDSIDNEVDPESLSSFLSNRVVCTQENLMQTNIVVIKNLATATTKPKIMKLCGGIGNVQNLQMDTNERQATIVFDTVASAHKFYNKYRRYMIDLSMIQVDLVPCESSS